MLIYGVCISHIEKINEEKFMTFLKELSDIGSGKEQYLSDFLETKKLNGDEYTINDWLCDFESNGYYGLAAFLKRIIEDIEGIDISCDDPNGVSYLGISADAPWAFNSKTKFMSRQKFEDILAKYINKVTDDVLNILWWSVNEDCDY